MTDNQEILCPNCGSDNISKPELDTRWMFISILIFMFPLPIGRRYRLCFDCGHKFRTQKTSEK